jgi:hemoglobin/transferrin/lactoferrin receptor protein
MRLAFGFLFSLGISPASEIFDFEVVDGTGAAVTDARATAYNAARVIAGSSQSGPDGKGRITIQSPGSYLLVISKSGFEDRTLVITTPASGTVRVQLMPSSLSEQVSVTAESGLVRNLEDVSQRANILTKLDLNTRSATALTEVANGETGVAQLRTSSTMGSFFVRGLTGKNVAVYRDGVRYTTSAQRGGVSTFQNLIEPTNLDSAEFLRGPNGAQYGSDAVGGTVNLQSLVPQFNSGSATPRWGGEFAPMYHSATNGFGGNTLLALNGVRAAFVSNLFARRINTFRTGGGLDSHAAVTRFLGLPSNVIGRDRLPDSAFTHYGGSMHAQFLLSPKQQLVAHYERGNQDGGKRYDQLLGGDGNLIADLRNVMVDFGYLRFQQFGFAGFDQASVTGSYNAQREERINQGGQGNPNAAITNQFERNRVWGAQFQLSKRLGGHDTLIGGEGYHERMTSPAFTFNPANGTTVASRPRVPDGATYKVHGLFVQDSWAPVRRLRLSGGLRFGGATYKSVNPSDSLTANAISGRVGAVVRLADPLSIHATYSRGFRAPNMTDLGTLGIQGNGFFEANVNDLAGRGAHIGNRADDQAIDSGLNIERLRPEKTDNYDIGMQLKTSRVFAEVTGFWIRLNNTIVSQTLILPQGATGQILGDQIISRQLASGAVFVPIATQPVLVRANFTGARLQGLEQRLKVRFTRSLTFDQNLTYIYAEDPATGLPPDIEPGSPPTLANLSLHWSPSRKFWTEVYSTISDRQTRIPSISLADRRTGASRSRTNIANFFNNGARVRGLVANGILIPTGETLAQVQNRVLGPTAASAPMFTAIPGWGILGFRTGIPFGERSDVFVDVANITDKNYRGIGWGMDGAGASVTLKWRLRF